MMGQVALFLAITLVVGLVNLIISEPLERPFPRELFSYIGVVIGGIAGFTLVIVVISALFQ
ncbi:MAG: hypothetical protein ACE5GW_01265 [Planctomycetota bacterium]